MVNMQIEFIASSDEVNNFVENPKPSKMSIPDWYKNKKSYYKKKPIFNSNGSLENSDLKMCMPFLDSISHGYIQKTWCDIYIEHNDNQINYYYARQPEIISIREKTNLNQIGFYPYEFTWKIPWITKMPKGWSILIHHPSNRIDLPFYTLSGIIDSDEYHHAGFGNLPFYIKQGFSGLIPSGTPMFQITPIKRENWTTKITNYSFDYEKRLMEQNSKFWEFYKKYKWQKKFFN
jgi:hypothetical protein